METAVPSDSGVFDECKRESRLTSIIDQLLHHQTTTGRSTNNNNNNKRAEDDDSATEEGNLESEATSVKQQVTARHGSVKMSSSSPMGLSSPSDHHHGIINKARRKKTMNVVKTLVKNERIATSPLSSRSPTPPVHQQQQHQQQQQPSLHHGFDMSRNYSDFMRSLAAKYNNANPNEDTQSNHRYALMDSTRFSPFAFSGVNNNKAIGGSGSASSVLTSLQQQHHLSSLSSSSHPLGIVPIKNLTYPGKTLSAGSAADDSSSPFHLNNPLSELMAAHYPAAFPIMDMSSTQALLNIVRSASAQNAQQLQSYLRPAASSVPSAAAPVGAAAANTATTGQATKRPLAVAVDHCPLDLSASVTSKRPAPAAYNYLDELSSKQKPSPKRTMTPIKMVTSSAAAVAAAAAAAAAAAQQQQKQLPIGCRLACAADACTPAAVQVRNWSVDDVVDFVNSIDLCSDYAQTFKDHSIDGSTLPLLTEDHLTSTLNMKLGPALKLRTVLAKKIGHCAVCLHCVHCHSTNTTGDTVPSSISPAITPDSKLF